MLGERRPGTGLLPPPPGPASPARRRLLWGRGGEGGMPHARVSDRQRGHARRLRRTMTRAETLLWRRLKAHRLASIQFRRQTPCGPYIADFCAHSVKLIIELDGATHDFEERIERDRIRDEWFVGQGYRVLRFTNDDVLKNLEGVVTSIADAARPPSLSLPHKGGGNHDGGAR